MTADGPPDALAYLAPVRAAIRDGARSLYDLKRRTRAGAGPCQGVYRLPTEALLLESEGGVLTDEIGPVTSRPPARPAPMTVLAVAKEP